MTLVVDSSAILAIYLREPEAHVFAASIRATSRAVVSAGNVIEAGRVVQIRSRGRDMPTFDRLLAGLRLRVAPVDEEQIRLARDGMKRFGQGRGRPPAVLNFGDLFAYALARHLNAPLLFKGNDFSRTDVTPAWTP